MNKIIKFTSIILFLLSFVVSANAASPTISWNGNTVLINDSAFTTGDGVEIKFCATKCIIWVDGQVQRNWGSQSCSPQDEVYLNAGDSELLYVMGNVWNYGSAVESSVRVIGIGKARIVGNVWYLETE